MKDESFELLTKMYSEFTAFKNDMTGFKNDMTGFKNDMTGFKNDMTGFKNDMTAFRKETGSRLDKIETTLEHDIKNKLQALHEREAANSDKLEEHSQRLNTIENKLDYLALSVNSQDRRLEIVESPKKKAK